MLFFFTKVFLFLLPFQFAFPLGEEDVPFLRLMAPSLLFLVGVKILTEKNKTSFPFFFLALLLSWLLSLTFSLLLAEDITLGIRKLLFLWSLTPLVFVWAMFLQEAEKILLLLKAVIFGGTLSALLGIAIFLAQFLLGVEKIFHLFLDAVLPFFLGEQLSSLVATYPSLLVNIGGETWLRATAFFPDPHVASFFFGTTACLALGLFLDTRKNLFLYSAGILLLADILTFSRGGYLGLAVALPLVFSLQQKKWGMKPLFGFMAFLPLLLWLGMPVYERFSSSFTLTDTSSLERLTLWKTAVVAIQEHPMFGLGLGNYAEWVHPGLGASIPYYAHNLYLDIAVEGGLLSLLLFLVVSGWSLILSLQRAFQGSGLAVGVAAALTLYFVHSLFETALFSTQVTILFSLLLVLPFVRISKKSPVE